MWKRLKSSGEKKMRSLDKKVEGHMTLCSFVILLMFVSALSIIFMASATSEAKEPITIGVPPWSSPPVKARVVKQILEDEGYDVELQNLDIGIVYQQMADDKMDCTLSAWLPTTHKEYWDQYRDNLEEVAVNEPDTFLGLVVPQYVCDAGITSITDLKGNASKFNNEIIGIEPGHDQL